MSRNRIFALVLMATAMAGTGPRSAWAQGAAESSLAPRPIGLEYATDPAGQPGTGPGGGATSAPMPPPSGGGGLWSRSTMAELANPFDGGSRPGRRGRRLPSGSRPSGEPMASEQGPGRSTEGAGMAPGRVANPFQAGYGRSPYGLFQQPSPQAGAAMPPSGAGELPGGAAGAGAAGELPGGAAAPGGAPGAEGVPGTEGVPGAPALPSTTTPGAAEGAAAPTAGAFGGADTFGGAGTETGAGFGGTIQAGAAPFAMIGDIQPISIHALQTTPPIPSPINPPGPPRPPGARGGAPIYPSVRNFNISENQSPRPQDRVFFNFNYYSNIGDAQNRIDLSPVTRMRAYIYNFGVEKTFNQGMGSVGIRIPLDNLTADSYGNIISTPTSTSPGNLTIFAKYILAQNPRTGSLVSACWAITPPTGPSRFAGAPYLFPLQSTFFQPCIAYIWNHDRLYLQGFSGFSFSMNPNDVSWVYNDIGIGYYVYRSQDPRAWLRAIAPVFEVHVNDPVNHRDFKNRFDIAGTPDACSLTYGLNVGFSNAAVLTAAFVTPVTTPKPFDCEAVLMLNFYYGRTRRTLPFTPPPMTTF